MSKDEHIVPLEEVCAYFQNRALSIYERTYGAASGNQVRPEKPYSEMVSDDSEMDMLDFCTKDTRKPSAVTASPRPPGPVYRGRTESFNNNAIDVSVERVGDATSPPAACWFEWTVFDCAHGEQMMVPKFLQIMREKILERSEYFK